MNRTASTRPGLNRRRFLRDVACMSSASVAATIASMRLTNAIMAAGPPPGDYKAMVCLFMFGGNDSFNMLMPHDTTEYADYLDIRKPQGQSGLAIPHNELLMVGDNNSTRNFGLHPSMTGLQSVYNAGNAAFVANIGSLVEPTDLDDYNSNYRLPLGLFSHSDLTRHWQTSVPQTRTHLTGWGGRMADILTDPSSYNDAIGMNISIGDLNLLQTGKFVYPYTVTPDGATLNDGYGNDWGPDVIFTRSIDDAFARPHSNLINKTFADTTRQAIDAAQLYNDATANVTLNTPFPGSYLGRQLQQVAKTIGAADQFNKSRQLFFVNIGGFDNHGDLIGPHAALMDDVSASMAAFYAATEELQAASQVVTFTASEFARTLSGNGQGSDHGWAGNQIVMGGAVNGGRIFGQYPTSLKGGNPLDVGRGSTIPTTSVDEYTAELAMWFGIQNNADLEEVLPNIRTFYGAGSSTGPLGFLT